jgi:hypothetical protein
MNVPPLRRLQQKLPIARGRYRTASNIRTGWSVPRDVREPHSAGESCQARRRRWSRTPSSRLSQRGRSTERCTRTSRSSRNGYGACTCVSVPETQSVCKATGARQRRRGSTDSFAVRRCVYWPLRLRSAQLLGASSVASIRRTPVASTLAIPDHRPFVRGDLVALDVRAANDLPLFRFLSRRYGSGGTRATAKRARRGVQRSLGARS